MKKIAIYGAGGFGREIKVLIHQINIVSNKYDLIGFFDDDKNKGDIIDGVVVLGGISELNIHSGISVVMAIGNPDVKKMLVEKIFNEKILFPNVFHPSVDLTNLSNKFGKGIVICSGTFVSLNVSIGDFVSINVNCTLGHDSSIGNYASLMPAVNISGNVHIGNEVFMGVGAVTNNDILIHDNVTIGAGSVVLKSINYPCVAMGNPAREMIKK
ncbi:NeuD/PglB/VioB family sugar acetyltransferase [Flavobacterium sp. LS1R10]|uniref:NeuD/PglB/VioB family sugar acetyltransferase n=1 Tax=Flavobacterium sp. LS1R10 TaxID=2497482 RepID=UPI000F81F76D|nr:NeuD/PglB/VioB family sugar acetyltransferase [Flavobacterium sp. LS1R10]RTY74262.1 acetyltransferase [Flavobacterium sp. LS1R10]